ncbi:MAG TPA: toll/interleukin-1 receptor domain-containing protein, partial [Chthoniobacterales bacterium]|nr:toll/interleukin-1 receptor domain-containing protein [Chthoniobacterales bacterium]
MSNHVFVSHSHKDASAAQLMVEALENRGVACWMAPRDVPPGGSYAEAILNAIESARCFVLIYSENSNVSSHVLREVERALKFDLNIVPIRFDDSMPSKSLDYLLATVHWLAIAPDSRDRSIVKAADQIAASLANARNAPQGAEPARASSSVPTAVAPVAPRAKWPLVWIAIPLVVVASLIYWLFSKSSAPARPTHKTEVAASAPAASPTISPELSPNELPVAVAHRYFSLLTKRNATAAYNLLSEEFRRHVSIARFSRTVGSKPAVKLAEAAQVSKTDRAASVAVVLEDTDPAANQARWKGNMDFVLEAGMWRIESMKGLYPASGRPIQNSANGSDDETTPNVSPPTPTP